MFLNLLFFFSISSYLFAATELSSEQLAFTEKIVDVLQSGNVSEYKKLIHSECPLDEAKVLSDTKSPWTKRYQVRVKKVSESFDLSKVKFKVVPEYVLEFQVWTKVTDPVRIKMMRGATEIELIKAIPVAKEKSSLKILDWPCYDSI